MITKKNTIIKINSFNTEGKVKASICAEKEICDFHIVVKENGTARTFNFDFVGNGKQADAEFVIENPLLWSTNTFNLYSFEIEIRYDNEKEIAYGKFGFRTISTNGKNVTLNGTPVFIRGFIRGIKCHDHQNNCKLATEEFYRKNLLQAKRYGFNYVRFHSTVPSEEFFNVADELGFLVHIELRQDGDEYNNLIEMVDTGRDNLDVDFVKNVIDRFYNHPSLIVYCIGNEIKGEEEHAKMRKSAEFIKSTDNSRLFLDTCAWGENNRELVDIDVQHMSYYFPFGKHADMFEDTDNLLVCGTRGGDSVCERNEYSSITRTLFFNVPLIAHEVCHYYDFNYSQITEDCDKIILDDFPVKVKSLISGTDKNVRDRFDAYKDYFNLPELQYDRTLRNFSYLFEVGVEKGKLLVCGLNMTGLDFNEPSTLAMSEFIKSYISSEDFAPINNISVKQLKEYMRKKAEEPVKEGMMTQFWQLDDTPVESKEYWKESEAYLRENDV